mmetsp:Transcript_100779/g.157393  ORF Transcript_100779/g.157393 Transcript_100779/m.157393 type:complete len:148 (+) Transcript_100779:908-1351(+)
MFTLVLEPDTLKRLCLEQADPSHTLEGTTKFPLPVSKSTKNCCAGDPIVIVPKYSLGCSPRVRDRFPDSRGSDARCDRCNRDSDRRCNFTQSLARARRLATLWVGKGSANRKATVACIICRAINTRLSSLRDQSKSDGDKPTARPHH